MRKFCAVCAVALVVLSSVGLFFSSEDSGGTPTSYSYTYDGYTVTQISDQVANNVLTVEYSIEGNSINGGSYKVSYPINNGVYSFAASNISEVNSKVIMIPPKIMNGEEEVFVSVIGSSTTSCTAANGVEKLYLLTDDRELSFSANFIRNYYSSLTDLVIKAKVSTANNLINAANNIERVYISEFVSMNSSNNLYNANNRTGGIVEYSFKTLSNTSIQGSLIGGGTNNSCVVKLLSGSVKASSLNMNNVSEVKLDRAAWADTTAMADLAESVTNANENATISFYGESSTPASFDITMPQNQMGIVIDKEQAMEGETVSVTLSPPQGKQVGAVSVVKEDTESVQTTVDAQNPNVYTFVMPASDVTVSATFEDIPAVAITPASDTVAKGASTTVTVSAVGLKDVSSLYITITYDEAKFNLKSPAYSNLLSSAPLKGDLTKGEYVVAFATPQNLSGDLLTFQLEAKDDAAVGACTIGCTVEINGTASGNSNTPEHTYTDTSALTIGNVLGDLDSDGDVDEDDAVYLLLYTFRASTYPIPEGQNVDYNNDGVINSDDAIYLKNYVVNPTQYPLGGA